MVWFKKVLVVTAALPRRRRLEYASVASWCRKVRFVDPGVVFRNSRFE